jgi:hypothetical protein
MSLCKEFLATWKWHGLTRFLCFWTPHCLMLWNLLQDLIFSLFLDSSLRCRLCFFWSSYPSGIYLVEATRLMWNKILLDPVHLVISSGDDDGLVRWRSTGAGSTASVFNDSYVGVMISGATRRGSRGSCQVCGGQLPFETYYRKPMDLIK